MNKLFIGALAAVLLLSGFVVGLDCKAEGTACTMHGECGVTKDFHVSVCAPDEIIRGETCMCYNGACTKYVEDVDCKVKRCGGIGMDDTLGIRSPGTCLYLPIIKQAICKDTFSSCPIGESCVSDPAPDHCAPLPRVYNDPNAGAPTADAFVGSVTSEPSHSPSGVAFAGAIVLLALVAAGYSVWRK